MTLHSQVLALVRSSARDWWRTRSAPLLLVVVVLVYALANFLAGLAVTEVAAQRITLHAGLARPLLALLFALVVVVGTVREFDDRALDTLLARPLSRRTWYLARLGATLVAAGVLAAVAALPLVTSVPLGPLAAWALSFGCELAIVGALALACATSLGRVAPAVGAVAGFYALSRSIAALVLMTSGPGIDPADASDRMVAVGVQALALTLPDFSRYADTAWLLGATAMRQADLVYALVQGTVYVALLAMLGLVDFARRDL